MNAQNSGKNSAKFKAYWWEAAICALLFSPVVMQLKSTQPWIVPLAMSAGAVIVLNKDSLIKTLVPIFSGLKRPQLHPAKTTAHR
jgi:hypothetical protein